jgi:hypothetical protein
MISSIKLVYLDGTAMVAVYGGDHEGDDDWQCNLPASEAILGDPSGLPAEQAVPLAAASQLVAFTPAFRLRLKPKPAVLRVPALVEEVSASTGVPAPHVHTIVAALLQQLAGLVGTGGKLDSPQVRIRPRTQPARAASEEKPARSARQFALLLARVN